MPFDSTTKQPMADTGRPLARLPELDLEKGNFKAGDTFTVYQEALLADEPQNPISKKYFVDHVGKKVFIDMDWMGKVKREDKIKEMNALPSESKDRGLVFDRNEEGVLMPYFQVGDNFYPIKLYPIAEPMPPENLEDLRTLFNPRADDNKKRRALHTLDFYQLQAIGDMMYWTEKDKAKEAGEAFPDIDDAIRQGKFSADSVIKYINANAENVGIYYTLIESGMPGAREIINSRGTAQGQALWMQYHAEGAHTPSHEDGPGHVPDVRPPARLRR